MRSGGAWKSWIRMVHALTAAPTAARLELRPGEAGGGEGWIHRGVTGSRRSKLPTSALGTPWPPAYPSF